MRWHSIVVLALLAGCASQPDPQVDATRQPASDVDRGQDGLEVTISSAVSDGRYLRFAGKVKNHSSLHVKGIRYTLQILVPGEPPRVAETFRRQVGTTLEAGEDKIRRLEFEKPIHASAAAWGYKIEAVPVTLGGEEVPPPPGWP